jgi:hypothetical protein
MVDPRSEPACAGAQVYASEKHESVAFTKWLANEDKINTHNAKGLSYKLGHNKFSDMTAEEFFGIRLGYNRNATRTRATKVHVVGDTPNPTSVDWVTSGAVTSIKDQGQCGSCWSFSAAGAIEGAYQIASGTLMDLSEEDLVQCDTTDSGCNGGSMENAFTWVESHGIASLSTYPYSSSTSSGTTGTCDSTKEGEPAVYVSGYTSVTSGSESGLLSAIAITPVSVAIEADQVPRAQQHHRPTPSPQHHRPIPPPNTTTQHHRQSPPTTGLRHRQSMSHPRCHTACPAHAHSPPATPPLPPRLSRAPQSAFQLYSSGVLDSTSCGTSLDHGVLAVGYGTDSSLSKDYYKVKNSWGTSWGESGYVRIVRGSNMCGIASDASYPTGAHAASARVAARLVEEKK